MQLPGVPSGLWGVRIEPNKTRIMRPERILASLDWEQFKDIVDIFSIRWPTKSFPAVSTWPEMADRWRSHLHGGNNVGRPSESPASDPGRMFEQRKSGRVHRRKANMKETDAFLKDRFVRDGRPPPGAARGGGLSAISRLCVVAINIYSNRPCSGSSRAAAWPPAPSVAGLHAQMAFASVPSNESSPAWRGQSRLTWRCNDINRPFERKSDHMRVSMMNCSAGRTVSVSERLNEGVDTSLREPLTRSA